LYAGVPPVDDRPVTTPRGRQTARRNRTPCGQRRSLSARVIAEIVGINRSTTHLSINTLIHRPSSTSCQPSIASRFTSEFWNASSSLQGLAAGASTYREFRQGSPGRVVGLRHQPHRSVGPVHLGAGDRCWPKVCRDRAPAFNQVGLGAGKRHDASSARVDSLPAISCRDRGGRETNSIIRIDRV
jgi:hypothetical protein